VEAEDGFRSERLETDEFEGLKVHGLKRMRCGGEEAWRGGNRSLGRGYCVDNKKHYGLGLL